MNSRHIQQNKYQCRRGFSLIELMVSVTVFSIVMVISTGTLMVLIDANARAQSLHVVMSNLSFSVDSITRNVRTGDHYYCTDILDSDVNQNNDNLNSRSPKEQNCSGDEVIVFTSSEDLTKSIGYRLSGGSIQQKTDIDTDLGDWIRITSDNVVITTFTVTVTDSTRYYPLKTDVSQPRASFLIQGYVADQDDIDTDFSLQTTVTQRTLNF